MTQNTRTAYLYALGSVLAWSTVSTAFKLTLRHLTPIGMMFVSSATALLFLVLVNLIKHKGNAFDSLGKNLTKSLLPGILNPLAYYLILFIAYDRLRAQEAQVLNYTWAIVLSMLSIIILKERFRWSDLAALLLSFLGVLVISTRGKPISMDFSDPLGSGLALSTSLIWASYWIINLKDRRDPELKLMYNFAVGTIIMLIIAIASGGRLFGMLINPDGGNALYGILGGIYVGIFEMGLTFILWMKALQSGNNTPGIANLIFLTPFVSLLFISLVLKEAIHPATLLGLCVIVGSNILQKLPQLKVR